MIVSNSRNHGREIASAAGCLFNVGIDPVIARVRDGKLVGGVIFRSYTGASINIHVASFDKNWINVDLLWVVFNYVFNQLGCNKLFATIPSGNPKLLAFAEKAGFIEEVKISDVFPVTSTGNGTMHVLGMYRDQCRWLNLQPKGLARV